MPASVHTGCCCTKQIGLHRVVVHEHCFQPVAREAGGVAQVCKGVLWPSCHWLRLLTAQHGRTLVAYEDAKKAFPRFLRLALGDGHVNATC